MSPHMMARAMVESIARATTIGQDSVAVAQSSHLWLDVTPHARLVPLENVMVKV